MFINTRRNSIIDMERNSRSAFTLIELLVVISIIALLVAILLPALSNARVASQRSVSLSNVRQITLAQHNYANDFKSSMPFLKQKYLNPDGTINTSDRWRPQWSRLLHTMGYINGVSVYWSPGRARSYATGVEDERAEFVGQQRPTAYSYESVGYGMNVAVAGGTENQLLLGSGPAPVRLGEASAPQPSEMLLLAESWATTGINTTTPVGSINGIMQLTPDRYNRSTSGRLFNYQGSIVRSYLDGRANASGSNSKGGTLVSGRVDLVGVANRTPTDSNEIGWDIQRLPQDTFLQGPYAGNWSYTHFNDRDFHAPWFRSWRTQWNSGLRNTTP